MSTTGGHGIDRRSFLVRSGTVGAAALLAGAERGTPAGAELEAAETPFDPSDWNSVRAQFRLKPGYIHLAAFVLASHPLSVQRAIDDYRQSLDSDPFGFVGANETLLEDEVRTAASRYLAVAAPEIALTDSTTMGLALVYNGLKLRPGEEILATEHDFYSTHESIRLRHEREGIKFRKVPLFKDPAKASVDEIVGSVRRAIRPETRLLAVTWVHSSTGLRLPIRAIADEITDINRSRDKPDRVLLSVDAVHGFGNQDVSPFDLGCDFFVSGTHKWLFGPRGTGLVWGKTDSWDRIVPTIPTFAPMGIQGWLAGRKPETRPPGPYETPGGFHSFEHRWALKQAFEFHLDIGRDRVAARTAALAQRLKEGLQEIRTVRVITPMDPSLSAGIICFEVRHRNPAEIVSALMRLRRIQASVTPYAQQYVRMGPSIVNTEQEIDETLLVLRAIA